MFNRRIGLVAALAGLAGALTTGAERLTQVAVASANFAQQFSARYGNNPRSLNGNSARNSKAAQQKRAAASCVTSAPVRVSEREGPSGLRPVVHRGLRHCCGPDG